MRRRRRQRLELSLPLDADEDGNNNKSNACSLERCLWLASCSGSTRTWMRRSDAGCRWLGWRSEFVSRQSIKCLLPKIKTGDKTTKVLVCAQAAGAKEHVARECVEIFLLPLNILQPNDRRNPSAVDSTQATNQIAAAACRLLATVFQCADLFVACHRMGKCGLRPATAQHCSRSPSTQRRRPRAEPSRLESRATATRPSCGAFPPSVGAESSRLFVANTHTRERKPHTLAASLCVSSRRSVECFFGILLQ